MNYLFWVKLKEYKYIYIMFTNFVCLPIHDFHPSVSSSVIFNSECLKMYFEQSWIFKSFSGMDAGDSLGDSV